MDKDVHHRSEPPADEAASARQDRTISVVLCDANSMMCELLAGALKRFRALNIVKCAVQVDDGYRSISDLQPNVAVISSHLGDGPYSGFRVLQRLQSQQLKTRTVMLVDHPERELVVDAFRGGARGVFKRSEPLTLLCRCITVVHSGQIWAGGQELQYLVEAVQKTTPLRCLDSRGHAILSAREEQIVPLVASGLTNKEISEKLHVSEHTIKNHLFRIYEKLGISSRVELILYAVTDRKAA